MYGLRCNQACPSHKEKCMVPRVIHLHATTKRDRQMPLEPCWNLESEGWKKWALLKWQLVHFWWARGLVIWCKLLSNSTSQTRGHPDQSLQLSTHSTLIFALFPIHFWIWIRDKMDFNFLGRGWWNLIEIEGDDDWEIANTKQHGKGLQGPRITIMSIGSQIRSTYFTDCAISPYIWS